MPRSGPSCLVFGCIPVYQPDASYARERSAGNDPARLHRFASGRLANAVINGAASGFVKVSRTSFGGLYEALDSPLRIGAIPDFRKEANSNMQRISLL